ncbi:cellulase family glycosylhydrolase [Paraconexibacter sp. AEG42_29]|uniref:cellulase family glycosylhydrolase n=1 Tax=Paraconexibacter sp. AEG42_29 TaxID=2997339 RepID=UPI00339D4F5D
MALVLAGTGAGTKYMETVVQDDAQFLHRSPAAVNSSARRLAELGATRLRLTAGWSALAPNPTSRKVPPAPFDSSDSKTYPRGAFTTLDTAVKAATGNGVDVMIDLAFWAPRWAVGQAAPNPKRERYFVDAAAFGDFATAVARRYSGAFPDPANPAKDLPAVRMYTTWNEPNHPSFLKPQWVRTPDGGFRPESPHVYRAMHNAGYDAVKRVSRLNKVLVGGTASGGSTVPGKGGVPPLQFVRAMACVDDRLKPLNVPECANYAPVKADGYSHHPYSRLVTPATSDPYGDNAPIADSGRLADLLDTLHERGRLANRLNIFNTEYGYESRQDDPFQPFERDQQAAFIGWSTFLAWRDPDTSMMAQFLLRDIDPAESGNKRGTRKYYRDWQTGLYDKRGDAKPAATGFKLPFWAQLQEIGLGTKVVLLFGQVRPGKGARTAHVERQDPASGVWSPIVTGGPSCLDPTKPEFLTNPAGFFLRTAKADGAARYRMVWHHEDDPGTEASVPIDVAANLGDPSPVGITRPGQRK